MVSFPAAGKRLQQDAALHHPHTPLGSTTCASTHCVSASAFRSRGRTGWHPGCVAATACQSLTLIPSLGSGAGLVLRTPKSAGGPHGTSVLKSWAPHQPMPYYYYVQTRQSRTAPVTQADRTTGFHSAPLCNLACTLPDGTERLGYVRSDARHPKGTPAPHSVPD